jgi:hypothetical protein
MDKGDIIMLYNQNNIKFQKCELYNDFTQSLLMTIFDTYLGDDVTIEHQVIHFNWAWNRTIDNFIDESLDFEEDKLYNYFLEFTLVYSIPNKTKWENNRILNIWVEIFDYTKRKTNSDIDVLIEIYIIFEKSVKNHIKKRFYYLFYQNLLSITIWKQIDSHKLLL